MLLCIRRSYCCRCYDRFAVFQSMLMYQYAIHLSMYAIRLDFAETIMTQWATPSIGQLRRFSLAATASHSTAYTLVQLWLFLKFNQILFIFCLFAVYIQCLVGCMWIIYEFCPPNKNILFVWICNGVAVYLDMILNDVANSEEEKKTTTLRLNREERKKILSVQLWFHYNQNEHRRLASLCIPHSVSNAGSTADYYHYFLTFLKETDTHTLFLVLALSSSWFYFWIFGCDAS